MSENNTGLYIVVTKKAQVELIRMGKTITVAGKHTRQVCVTQENTGNAEHDRIKN